jgi:hypothetical protein
MELDFSQKIIAPDDVLVRVLDGEAVVLNLESESYFGLDEVGTRMWTLLTESDSIQDAYDILLAEYDVEPAQLKADMADLIAQLQENGLVAVEHGQLG